MTMSSKKTFIKSDKNVKVASFVVDVLAIYKSDNEIQVPLAEALKSLKERYSGKTHMKIQKCVMQIWLCNKMNYIITLKEKKKILELFDINCIGTPSCSQMVIAKYQAQSLVFLPVLNKDNKSELFIFHPHHVSAQEIVIKIASILEILQKENEIQNKSLDAQMLSDRRGNSNNGHDNDTRSLFSISSDFINTWYGKMDSINTMQISGLSSLANIHEELHTINQYLKDIRHFMNKLFNSVHSAVQERKRKVQETLTSKNNGIDNQIIHLPSKVEFVEIVEKIKTCLNLATVHKEIIINPSSDEIINQLFIFLKIIGDATINNTTGKPDLLCGIKSPQINSSTVKFLTEKLNSENLKYWMILGYNFGYLRGGVPNQINRNPIDEFQIKEISNIYEYDQRNYPLSHQQHFQSNSQNNVDSFHENEQLTQMSIRRNVRRRKILPLFKSIKNEEPIHSTMRTNRMNNNRSSPVPLINNDTIYRTYPRLFEPEKKAPLFHESETLQYQNLSSHSPHVNCYPRSNNSTWDDRQCRFIDAIQMRNGRIGKVVYDRSAQNYRELGVSCNEKVEILNDLGDILSIKNALGEIGECPKSVIKELHSNYSR